MQEVFEKIIEQLKAESIIVDDDAGNRAVEIIEQAAAEYNNGWIPADNPPEDDSYILLSFSNVLIPLIGRYKEEDGGGVYYMVVEGKSCVSQDIFVNAWQPLPEPYRENRYGRI